MNSLREENEQSLKAGRKTPLTPRVPSRASANIEHKTSKSLSTPSPLPLQSPRKFQTGRSLSQSEGHVQPVALNQSKSGLDHQEKTVSEFHQVNNLITDGKIACENTKPLKVSSSENEYMKVSDENVFTFPKSDKELKDASKTPEYIEMEIEDTPSHVRRIDFGKVKAIEEQDENHSEMNSGSENDLGPIEVEKKDRSGNETGAEGIVREKKNDKMKEIGFLSQSAGQVSLKMLLERKDLNENNLNKSLGFVNSVNNSLFSSQSNNLSRSAFVPFSHSRKEISQQCSNISSDMSSSLVSYKQSFSTASHESLPKSATITITPVININQGAPSIVDNMNRPPDNIIHIQPGNTYQENEPSLRPEIKLGENQITNKQSINISSFPPSTKSEEDSTITSKAASIQGTNSTQEIKNISSFHVSPGANKQIKTPRFTPIKPKSSPQKPSSYPKTSSDIPTYDKRPVSAILKEKREREKAEALAKLHATVKIPTIQSIPGLQFQHVTPALTLNSEQIRNIAPISLPSVGSVPTKELLIFVNNSTAQAVPTVIAPASSQSFKKQISDSLAQKSVKVTKEFKKTLENDDKNHSEHREVEIISESANDGDCTPSIEEIILSPEESETSLKETSGSEKIAETVHEAMDIEKTEDTKSLETDDNWQGDLSEERFDSIESQTPVKIAKLNINAPFRSESACSLGRETPIRIMKTGDSSLSRPESACSHGRETPSGGRKRKSSGNTQQRNFKRLNSTGEAEDIEITTNFDLGSNILPSQKHDIRTYNQRRTHSCTLELDKEKRQGGSMHHHKSLTLDNVNLSLQSPDITSLEREALIDAFPHTVCSIKPSKAQNMQKNSVGVSSEAFRNALKLKKQQEYLNKRVNSFLMKAADVIQEQSVVIEKQESAMNESKSASVNMNSDASAMNDPDEALLNKGRELEIESDIPSDVADFINETIEKRQTENNSALSEPNFTNNASDHQQMEHADIDDNIEEKQLVTDSIKFLGVNVVNPENGKFIQGKPKSHMQYSDSNKDDHFMVPKVPPFNFKIRDSNIRFPNPEAFYNQQRCSSLPTFTSPVRSPVSPLGRQGIFQRSSSISPGVGQSPDREISNISQGALRMVDIRENHPISVNVHPKVSLTDDGTFVRPNSLPIRITHHDEKVSQIAPYLASIQHNLQKPRETPIDPRHAKQKDSPLEKQGFSSSPLSRNQLSREPSAERTSFTPFSDRGYHSIGNSPISTSTPVSMSEVDTSANLRQSPRNAPSGIEAGALAQASYAMSMGQLVASVGSSVVSINQLTTSTTSAFIPIQGSSNEIRYVTPIRPMATVANEKVGGTVLNPNGQEIQTQVLCASNRVQAPPPYEYAVRQLRESNGNLESNDFSESSGNLDEMANQHTTDYTDPVVTPSSNERVPLLANMGQDLHPSSMKQMGPCASRLAELSRQSKQCAGVKPSTAHPSIISSLNEPTRETGQVFVEHNNSNNRLENELATRDRKVIGLHETGISNTVRNSSFIQSNYFNNDHSRVGEQNYSVSEVTIDPSRQTADHESSSDLFYGQTQVGRSLRNMHSSDIGHQLGDNDETNSHRKIYDPSLNIISSENFFHSASKQTHMTSISQKVLSSVCKHSTLSSDICNLGQNIQPDDPYQEMTRSEFSNSEVDPLGSTLEDLVDILSESDKAAVVDSGFYSGSDIVTGEEGLNKMLFSGE